MTPIDPEAPIILPWTSRPQTDLLDENVRLRQEIDHLRRRCEQLERRLAYGGERADRRCA